MIARGAGEADDGIAMDADEASGLSNAVALGEMMKHSSGLLVGHAAIEQRGALALREAGLAGVAIEQSDVVVLAVASADGEVSGAASPVGGTVGILAAEAREIIHNDGASRPAGWLKVQGLGFKLLDILRCPIALCSVVQGHHQPPGRGRRSGYSRCAGLRLGSWGQAQEHWFAAKGKGVD